MENDTYYEVREALDVQWGALFKELDFLPIILPFEYDFEKYFENMKIDGILLTGGNDLYRLNQNNISKQRDEFEKKLIEYGIKNNIPIFGVCRGMQIIAEYFGADLVKVENQTNIRHSLVVNINSKYFNLLNTIKDVNSFHNYAVDNLPDELLLSSSNGNGIIKAIEHKKYKIFGQMWHSERETPFNSAELSLIKNFFITKEKQ